MSVPGVHYDLDRVEAISDRFDLRTPNRKAFDKIVATLAGSFDPDVPQVLSLATGAGKTYIMAALVEYLRECGIRDVLVVTPSSVVQTKTVGNFTLGATKYIDGALVPPTVVTPAGYDSWRHTTLQTSEDGVQLFVLNVHQLVAPSTAAGETKGEGKNAVRRAFRTFQESAGNPQEYLRSKNDLVIIADEHHLYSDTAKAFKSGIRELAPAAVVGLTASAGDGDHVIDRYSLRQAIEDRYVKRPVLAFRKGGYGQHGEEQQLRDAKALLGVKQAAYEAYWAANPDKPRVNAVMFVQCADVNHATATAELLAGPEFFGNGEAVLQVDNQHNDQVTLNRLANMDQPDSRVRAVVSVNKLKEGWDAKNVAVMVTLRAMASDVLTQQTLGRGLRLPFSKWTGVSHIDQLDIIAHESFVKMLSDEQVLSEFGMEDLAQQPTADVTDAPALAGPAASSDTVPGLQEDSPITAAVDYDDVTEGTSNVTDAIAPTSDPETEHFVLGGGTVNVFEFGQDAIIGDIQVPETVTVTLNTEFEGTTFLFPATTIRRADRPFELVSIPDQTIRDAAKKISSASGTLLRQKIVFRGKVISTQSEDDVTVDDINVPIDEVKTTLATELLKLRAVARTPGNLAEANTRIVGELVDGAGLSEWSVKSMQAAVSVLNTLVQDAATNHTQTLGEDVEIHARELPIASAYTLRVGEHVKDLLPIGSGQTGSQMGFEARQHYGQWRRGLFTAAKFDAFDTEYLIADMLDRSSSIRWWKRLYPEDRARIAYTATSNYHPDFVAFDTDDRYWIIEGKAQAGTDDEVVRAKRDAAEEAIRRLRTHPDFTGQLWGYAIAFQADVAKAESWEDLIAAVDPVKTKTY